MVQQRFDDFAVAKFEQLRTAIDDGYLHTKCGEHNRVFEADNAAANDDHRARHPVQREDLVGVEDGLSVKRNVSWSRRSCAGCQQDVPAFEDVLLAMAGDLHVIWIDEGGFAAYDI